MSWFLVAFYVVASCRAFLPGICATQNAMDAQNAADSCAIQTSGLPSCCASRALGEAEDGESSDGPVTPQEAHCPFCTLVMSAAPVPCHVDAPEPAHPAFTPPLALVACAHQYDGDASNRDRAPPA